MLRARKKDVRIKPNRKLDKRSSRGMLYENEELRLRTIEINAEVERGQTDIKKLRRENDHLRREMWALRDEYERLEKLIKHLDLAGTGSEDHHHSQHASDGEGGGGTEREDDDDGDDDDRASPSINGRHSNSEASDDDDREADEKEPGEGVAMAISRSKSQTAMTGDFRHSTSAPTASNCDLDAACYCNEAALATANCDRHRVGLSGAVYVECGNPVKDNIENYQKAYGRMPRRCSSAGAKVYVATQHFHPHVPSQTAAASSPVDASSRVCYESLSAVKSRYSTSGMEDEDGYAACSHPVRVDLRDFLHPVDHPSECANHFSMEASTSLMPPNTPPPPVPSPATTTIITTAIHHPVHGREGMEEAAEEGESSGVEADDEPSAHVSEAGGIPPDTPSEDGEFNLDHLVNIVRSFQQEQQLHQSGLVVATCSGSPPTPSTPDVLVEEAEDDAGSNYSSSPGTSGMATIKRRPISGGNQQQQQQQQRLRQMAIVEKEPASPLAMDAASGTIRPSRAIAESSSTDIGVGDNGGSSAYAQQAGRVAGWSSMPQRRNSFSSSSSSSASGSPTAIHSSTVVFLNNNNNNTHNINNNKKLAGSSGYLGRGGVVQGPDTTIAVTAASFSTTTTTTIDGIVVTSSRKSTSPIRIVHPPRVLPVPPPLSSYDVPRALQPPMALTNHGHPFGGALSRRRADETNRGLGDANCLSVYPLPDGDASASLLRLHAVDPHTVSFDLKDVAAARSITVQEVIDQLEQQLDPTRCHVRGVRMLAGSLFFISLDSVRSLQYLLRHSFRLRGHRVRLTDVSAQTWIVSLSGVPHYISDATVSLLLAAFGTIIGDVERRFFHGVDTGERLVRFRLKAHAKLPKHITVGGCRIQVRRMSPAPNASQRDHSGSGGFGSSCGNTSFPTGMNRRVQLESQNDAENSDFAFSSTAPEPGTSSAMAAESHYGTIQSASAEMGRKYMPKIGRSFEYRSQLRVDLRMSAEVPVPSLLNDEPASSPGPSSASVAAASRVPPTPNCLLCEQQQQQTAPALSTPAGLQPQIRPQLAPPSTSQTMVIHRCRHHESPAVSSPVGQGVPVAAAAPVPPAEGRVHRESPPKSRVSVNFDETAAISSGSRINSGTGTGRPSNSKTSTSTSSNGILRKSVSGEEPSTESGNDGSNSATGFGESGQAKGKNGLRLAAAKKTARSFSLVDTFRVNKERRKPVVRVETVIENTSAANPEEGVRTLVVRRDSTESSSRSSRSSRKSNELPWCGCWGNGCL